MCSKVAMLRGRQAAKCGRCGRRERERERRKGRTEGSKERKKTERKKERRGFRPQMFFSCRRSQIGRKERKKERKKGRKKERKNCYFATHNLHVYL